MTSFLYPRQITITRPDTDTGVGELGYGGLDSSRETTIAVDIAAKIQADRQGTAPGTRLPGDAAGQSIWKIIFRAANGLVRTHDIITDELGNRYDVIAAYWGPLVTTCRCQILQT